MNRSGLDKYKRSLVALSMGSLLSFSATSTAAVEESVEEVERISITGSRIKRTQLESASPIVSFSAATMESTGYSTVADVLRNSSLNPFGSFGGESNNGWAATATMALKGADPRQTLILIDGVRMSKSPIAGGTSNLNLIPNAAIERIDVLTDGASSVYGSDAVAGVINIVLKKEFDGIEFGAKSEFPDTVKGADSQNFTFTGGLSSDKGSMVFSWEHYEKDAIFMSDFDYAKAQLQEEGLDPSDRGNWHGVSGTGRTVEQASNGWASQALNTQNNCDVYNTGQGSGTIMGPFGTDSVVCGYDYTDSAQLTPDYRRDSLMANLTYELTDDIQLYARGLWMNSITLDISAGVPAWFPTDQALPERSITTEDGTDLTLTAIDEGGWFGYRMNTLGDRTAEHSDSTFDFVIGLEGSIGDAVWDLNTSYARYDAFTWGTNYTSTPALTAAIGSEDADGNWSGWDPRDPDSVPPGSVRANFDKRRFTEQLGITGGISFDVMELPAGTMSSYVGASHTRDTYYSYIDAQAEADNVGGGNGGSGGEGSRTVESAFFELVIPVIDDLEVNLAARYDNFSDFGSTFNPALKMSYRPVDTLLLRASIGTGFQAPLLTDLYGLKSRGHLEDETNYIACYQEGISIEDCDYKDSYWGTSGGNEDLQPEESENTNIGFVWEFADGWSTTVDYWTLDVDQRVSTIDEELIQIMQINLWETEGPDADISSQLPGVSISYQGGANNIDEIISPRTNSGTRETAGTDVTIRGNIETSSGDFSVDLNWTHMMKFKTSFIDENGDIVLGQEELGALFRPEDRVTLQLGWTLDSHNVALSSTYLSAMEDTAETVVDGVTSVEVTDTLDSYLSHNLSYTYYTPWNSKVSLGILNLLEETPPRAESDPRSPVPSLYDIRERVFTVGFTQTF
ncbi:TonB-dependent receptor [Pseudoalteromonas sp. C2R02]|uniref:TonB-dependent receptor domain-containing protein n=1 Tax=Pseudoalteromonas sp. C2R02 TaxID=2841565 RepID=UPI001C083DB5|nr:TonB-dependent receptor [Pseudoalteromonas sp. C2R02]MBU2971840.1 TonB-dependent receptor [Pseudoalteromonas sp. C2R02]